MHMPAENAAARRRRADHPDHMNRSCQEPVFSALCEKQG